MSAETRRFMRMLVFFDLPVATKADRKAYAQFRKFLVNDGYDMLQFSVYGRIVANRDAEEKHYARGPAAAPLQAALEWALSTNYVHYGYAADASKFVGGLRAGGYATQGPIMTGPQAQQLLALPHASPPDAYYIVRVPRSVPVVGPGPVAPTVVPPRSGGGVEFIFPAGTPPGSVSGPRPLPTPRPPGG